MIIGQSFLESLKLPKFQPFPGISSGIDQTIASQFWPQLKERFPKKYHKILINSYSNLILVENLNKVTKKNNILLLHGLTGSYQSKYLIRLANKLSRQGHRVFRLNLRNTGPGLGLAQGIYHSGRSEDLRPILMWIQKNFPHENTICIGYSLSGNIVLKTMGEDGKLPTGNTIACAAVSPPADLEASRDWMNRDNNRFFNRYFVKEILKSINELRTYQSQLPPLSYHPNMRLYDIDNQFTAKVSGFKNADHYYRTSQAKNVIPNLDLPSLILHSQDDPIVNNDFLLKENLKNTETIITKFGGHLGFLGSPKSKLRWMDEVLLAWINLFN